VTSPSMSECRAALAAREKETRGKVPTVDTRSEMLNDATKVRHA
jgi:hypothetical protein